MRLFIIKNDMCFLRLNILTEPKIYVQVSLSQFSFSHPPPSLPPGSLPLFPSYLSFSNYKIIRNKLSMESLSKKSIKIMFNVRGKQFIITCIREKQSICNNDYTKNRLPCERLKQFPTLTIFIPKLKWYINVQSNA